MLFLLGMAFVLVIWGGAFYIYLKYMKVSEKIWLRSLYLAGAATLIQAIASLILNLFGIGWLAPFITAVMMAYVLSRVLATNLSQTLLASILIVVAGPFVLMSLGQMLLFPA